MSEAKTDAGCTVEGVVRHAAVKHVGYITRKQHESSVRRLKAKGQWPIDPSPAASMQNSLLGRSNPPNTAAESEEG